MNRQKKAKSSSKEHHSKHKPAKPKEPGSGVAISALILSICALLIGWVPVFGWVFILFALIFGILAIKKKQSKGMIIASFVMIWIAFLIAVFVMVAIVLSADACQPSNGVLPANKDCFIDAAQACYPYSMVYEEEYGTVQYETFGCRFNKTIITIYDSDELNNLLQDTSASCKYNEGEFNREWINTLHLGLESCDGELRQRLGELLLFI